MKSNKRYLLGLLLLGIVAVFIVLACGRKPREVRVDNIERIFMHERGHYTFLVRQDDGILVPVMYSVVKYGCSTMSEVFLTDVPEGEPAWATWQEKSSVLSNPPCTSESRLAIHLHSTNQILAAGWDHGKFGSGMTQVVE